MRANPGDAATGRHARRLAHLIALLILAIASAWSRAASPPVYLLSIDGAIGPGTADYVVRGIENASKNGAQLIVLKIDTPGGLDGSMRTIIKAILASPIPVASYVMPSGARAASAGTYILYASHIAAMAPGTNLGAATPVQIGMEDGQTPKNGGQKESGKKDVRDAPNRDAPDPSPEDGTLPQPMTQKQVNDAAAYMRSLAQLRGRNAEWGEQAVRAAASLPAAEALRLRVIDYMAGDISDLLRQLDNRHITTKTGTATLHTIGAPTIDHQPDWRARFLATITDPGIALLLLTVGIYALILEFSSPGIGAAGVLGGISLLVALYALQLLPVNYAGLALLVLGLGCMVAEGFVPSFGALGVGGIIAFATGAVILIDTDAPGYGIPLGLIAAIAVVSAALIGVTINVAMRSRRLAVVSGEVHLIGSVAEVLEAARADGWASVHGEIWHVSSTSPLRRGQHVKIVGRTGSTLEVMPLTEQGE